MSDIKSTLPSHSITTGKAKMGKICTAFILICTITIAFGSCPEDAEFKTYCKCWIKKFFFVPVGTFVDCTGLSTDIIVKSFGQLKDSAIARLKIQKGHLEIIEQGAFNGLQISKIEIINSIVSYIEEGSLGSIDGLNYLLIKSTQLSKIPDLTNATRLTDFIIENEVIEDIVEEDFPETNTIERLAIKSSRLANIFQNSFVRLKKLEKLDLSGNILRNLPVNLSLSETIKEIDLNNNHLKEIPLNMFDGLHNLKSIDISHNLLRILTMETFQDLLKQGTRLKAKDNPFVCDKTLCWLAALTNEWGYIYKSRLDGKCLDPKDNRQRYLTYLKYSSMVCED